MQRLHTCVSGLLERVYREASRPPQQASLQNQHVYMNKMHDYIILHVSQMTILITSASRLYFTLLPEPYKYSRRNS